MFSRIGISALESNGPITTSVRYGVALAAVGLALILQQQLAGALGGNFPFICQYGAVAVSVWLCGWRPAAVAALVGFILVGVFFTSPGISFPTQPLLASAAFAAYALSTGLIIWMGESMRRQKRKAEARGERLECELARRREAEEALRQRHEELDVMIDAMPAFVWMAQDPACTRIRGNRAVRELLGDEGSQDVRERRLEDDNPAAEFLDDEGRALTWEELPMQKAAASGQAIRDVTLQIRLRNGRKLWVIGNAAPVFGRDGKVRGVIAAFVDQTRKIEAETARERLRREAADRAAELQTLLEAAPMAVWIAQDRFCRQINGNQFADRVVMRAERGSNVSRSADGPAVAYRVLKNGTALTPEELPMQRAAATGQPVLNEDLQLIFPDGRSVHLLMNAEPLFDSQGAVRGCIAAGADITRLKETERELRAAQELLGNRSRQLEQLVSDRTAKLRESVSELEAFAFQLVHDLRAPLVTIRGVSKLLSERPADFAASNYIQKIAASADKMDSFVHDVLRYSRFLQENVEIEPVDAGAVLRSCLGAYSSFQEPAAKIELVGEFPIVHGNRSALVECVTQLLRNAVKFVKPGVTPHVRVWTDTRDGWSTFYFEDDGIGIPKTAQARIFDVFQRVDRNADGSGLGLTIVKKAVERMGGKVGVQSESGHGSLFWIQLKPVMQQP